MATPRDDTDVIRNLRDAKDLLWKTITPMKMSDRSDFLSSLSQRSSHTPQIATRLNFSNLDESRIFPNVAETPDSLKRKLVHTEAELQATRAKVKEKESFISVMEPVNKKMCLGLENELEKYKKQSEFDSQKIEELKSKLTWGQKQIMCAKKEADDVRREKKHELDLLNLKIVALQQDCSNMKVEVANVKSEKTEAVRKLNMEIGKLELKVSMLTEEAEKSQEYIQSLKRQNSEIAEKVGLCNSYQTELKEAQAKITALENKIEADKDASLIIASRQNDLKQLEELQKENAILKEETSKYRESNVLLYEEKLWSLQEKLNQAERKCSLLPKLQVENEQMKSRLNQWEDLVDDKSASYKSPTAFSRKLSQYQQKEAVLTNKLAELASHCDILEKQKMERDEAIKSMQLKLDQNQMILQRQESVIKRLQRKTVILTKEKEHSRKLLDSYLSETTLNGAALSNDQITQLEDINLEYKAALEKCEKEIDLLNEKLKLASENPNFSEGATEVKKLRSENSTLMSQLKELQAEVISLQTKVNSKNETVAPSSDRVLHFRLNPVETANRRHLAEFGRLRTENDELKKRVQVLEEEGRAACDVTMKVREKLVSEGSESTLQALRDQLSSAERQKKFILESAKSKSTEFREAVYRLTGYKVDMLANRQFKLSHLYADSREDHLLFQVDSNDVQLIETEYSHHVSGKIKLYLEQHDSFPAFLASLTLDLFNQQTFIMEA